MASLQSVLEQYFTVYHTPPFPADACELIVDGMPMAVGGDLSQREVALLKTLAPQPASRNPWAQFLVGSGSIPTNGVVRLIQFNTAEAPNQPALWLDALLSLLMPDVTGFWLTPTHAVVVEPQTATPLDEPGLLSILDTLDPDFDTKTRGYLGQFWPVNAQLPAIFAEEQRLAANSDRRCACLASSALAYYTHTARRDSPLLGSLREVITEDAEMRPVIVSLYEHLGNLTATAKALYIHRNTLQYRLDKFQQATGFSLRQMDDLVLCYLLVQGA
ncbi:PucR family transcriptional regulator [Lacticaseibacillus sp. N501-2]|uniref:PucR family transcriptional regulator n=1 Tax=Lacticaseibacillus salsurae TaxID=3367729 RepID=UPI0038B2758F